MSITFNESDRIFKLDTAHTTYAIGIVDEEGFLGHIYYGKRIEDDRLANCLRTHEPPFVPSENNRDRVSFYDSFPMEYPAHGLGDYRESCIRIRTLQGVNALSLTYAGHSITKGISRLPGLPCATCGAEDGDVLEITLTDSVTKLSVCLRYGVFEKADVITRSVCVANQGSDPVYLTKVYSACLDMDDMDFEAISLHGSWARERQIDRRALGHAKYSVESLRGETSHQDQPFLALCTPNTTQETGEVYAMHFIYSGNFKTQAQIDQFGQLRMVMGLHPEDFEWKLEPADTFQTPEVVMVYSDAGLGKMTRIFHDFYRKHVISRRFSDVDKPVLINNWEATYFEFDTEKLIDIAKQASALGIEMLVMDDGWFGNRCDDNRALGDWIVNEEKLPGGLSRLVSEVNKLGMKFGIWFEPEMISPDSDLYRAHPDWAITIPGREGSLCRNQYVLDLTRKEVLDYVYNAVASILRSAPIAYVKWDMNRQLSDLYSAALPPDRMGELSHRYVLAVYALQERLLAEFPDLLLENCSGGGARFDPGMLYYSPQIWCSDDTDAIERLKIQEGTMMVYPLSAMGAHVSDCPNHTVGRTTPFATRGYVALAGTFGYELDVTKISEEERAMIPEQVALYHRYNKLVREGDYYRIASYSENHEFDCYGVVRKDKSEALFTYVQVLARPNYHSRRIRLQGLLPEGRYILEDTGETYSGEVLMNVGLFVPEMSGDYQGRLLHFTLTD